MMSGRELKKLCEDNRVTVNDLVDIVGYNIKHWNSIFYRSSATLYEIELNIKLAIEIKKLRLKVKLYENQFQFINNQEAKKQLEDDLAAVSIGRNVTDRTRHLG